VMHIHSMHHFYRYTIHRFTLYTSKSAAHTFRHLPPTQPLHHETNRPSTLYSNHYTTYHATRIQDITRPCSPHTAILLAHVPPTLAASATRVQLHLQYPTTRQCTTLTNAPSTYATPTPRHQPPMLLLSPHC